MLVFWSDNWGLLWNQSTSYILTSDLKFVYKEWHKLGGFYKIVKDAYSLEGKLWPT